MTYYGWSIAWPLLTCIPAYRYCATTGPLDKYNKMERGVLFSPTTCKYHEINDKCFTAVNLISIYSHSINCTIDMLWIWELCNILNPKKTIFLDIVFAISHLKILIRIGKQRRLGENISHFAMKFWHGKMMWSQIQSNIFISAYHLIRT